MLSKFKKVQLSNNELNNIVGGGDPTGGSAGTPAGVPGAGTGISTNPNGGAVPNPIDGVSGPMVPPGSGILTRPKPIALLPITGTAAQETATHVAIKL